MLRTTLQLRVSEPRFTQPEPRFTQLELRRLLPLLMTFMQIADLNFPTRWATFRLLGFEAYRIDKVTGLRFSETALALVLGDFLSSPPIVRIHSQCTTGEVFHSLRCDCHDQLHLALKLIVENGAGVLVYEQQEGRGIGLMEKLRTYELQDQGLDTVEANLCLGHAVDARDYALPVQILRFLKIKSLRLISNNPEKVQAVLASGIEIVERIAADVPHNAHSSRYLATKRDKLGHLSRDSSGSIGRPSIRGNQASRGALLSEAAEDAMDYGLRISAALGGD
jgi:GTP cyclohydrolase II